jgi:hypothetical protein
VVWGLTEKKFSFLPPALPFGLRVYPSRSRKEIARPRPQAARRRKARKGFVLQKATGQLAPRVQLVGPEPFGIVAIDPAKARSRYFLADC